MPSPRKSIEIIAGPNGSGKTTFARAYLKLKHGHSRFINADTIATGLAAGNEGLAAFHAGRVMLEAIREALSGGVSFTFETTLSGRTWEPLIKEARLSGYAVTIYFVYLKKVSQNLKRIQQRVKEGGHSIPKETVLRRFPRSFENFWRVYRLLSGEWFIFDNSGNKPVRVQSRVQFDQLGELDRRLFENRFLAIGGIT